MPAPKTDVTDRLRRRGDRLSLEAAAEIDLLRDRLYRRHSHSTVAGILKAKRGGKQFGGLRAAGMAAMAQAMARAEKMRPVMAELAKLSANKAAAELNRRGVKSATGGSWSATTVLRVRRRLRRLARAARSQ